MVTTPKIDEAVVQDHHWALLEPVGTSWNQLVPCVSQSIVPFGEANFFFFYLCVYLLRMFTLILTNTVNKIYSKVNCMTEKDNVL